MYLFYHFSLFDQFYKTTTSEMPLVTPQNVSMVKFKSSPRSDIEELGLQIFEYKKNTPNKGSYFSIYVYGTYGAITHISIDQ